MKNIRKTLKQFPAGHGHKKVSVMLEDGTWLNATTNNMPAIDAAFDEYYNEDPDVIAGDRFYESREEAQDELIDEIFRKNQFFAFQDKNAGFIQWVGVGKDEFQIATEFKNDVGIDQGPNEIVDNMVVTELSYDQYLTLIDRAGDDQEAINLLESYK